MAFDRKLLEILRCPRSGRALRLASDTEQAQVREALEAGRLSAEGADANAVIDQLLITDDGAWAYPVTDGVPVMLVDQALPMRELLDT